MGRWIGPGLGQPDPRKTVQPYTARKQKKVLVVFFGSVPRLRTVRGVKIGVGMMCEDTFRLDVMSQIKG